MFMCNTVQSLVSHIAEANVSTTTEFTKCHFNTTFAEHNLLQYGHTCIGRAAQMYIVIRSVIV